MGRAVRAVLAVLLVVSLAGCANYQSVEEQARVVVVNDDDTSHQLLVEVLRDDVPVVRESRAVRAGNSWSLAVPLERTDHELRVTTNDGGEVTHPFGVPVADDEDAYLRVTVAPNGTLQAETTVRS